MESFQSVLFAPYLINLIICRKLICWIHALWILLTQNESFLGYIGRLSFSCRWVKWPCDIFTILNMRACHQVFISTVFTVSHVELQLPQPLRLYQSRPNGRLSVSVLMYSICFESCTSSRLHSGPFRDISGSRLTYGEDCRNMSEAARLWTSDPPDVSIHIVFKQTPSLWRRHWAVRKQASQREFLTSRFSSSGHFSIWKRLEASDVEACTCCYRGALRTTSSNQLVNRFEVCLYCNMYT